MICGILKSMQRIKSFLINVSVLLVTLLLFSVVVEFSLASFYPQKDTITFAERGSSDTFDSIAGWTDYKNSMYRVRTTEYDNVIRVNSEGFDDDEWVLQKGANETRIVALGDSFTQAVGVRKDRRFTDVLSQLLTSRKSSSTVSVLNFGAGGYSTCNEYVVLVNKSMKYSPDAVVLFFYLGNDFFENVDSSLRRPSCNFAGDGSLVNVSTPVRVPLKKVSFLNSVTINTHLGRLFMNTFRYSSVSSKVSRLLGNTPKYPDIDLLDVRLREKNVRVMNVTLQSLKGMSSFLKSENVPFVVVIIPNRIQVQNSTWKSVVAKYAYNESEYDSRFPERYLSEYFVSENISLVSLYDPLTSAFGNDGEDLYFSNDGHLNERGHVVVASEVYKFFAKVNVTES